MHQKKKILFVDDEQNSLDGLKRMLHSQHKEWDMCFTTSVDEAINELTHTEYDVIISEH